MAAFDDVLDDIKDSSVHAAKTQLQELLQQAKADSSVFARDNAAALERWIVELRDGEVTRARASELARMVMRDNAAKLYGIK